MIGAARATKRFTCDHEPRREFLDYPEFSRRDFMRQSLTGAGAAWLGAQWPEILGAHEHARQAVAAVPPPKLEFFTAPQAADVEAICAAIIPTTNTPGAREAGVVYFIDRGLMTFAKDQREPFLAGLAAVTQVSKKLFPAAASFAALPAAQQVQVLKALEAMKPGEKGEAGAPVPSQTAGIDGA